MNKQEIKELESLGWCLDLTILQENHLLTLLLKRKHDHNKYYIVPNCIKSFDREESTVSQCNNTSAYYYVGIYLLGKDKGLDSKTLSFIKPYDNCTVVGWQPMISVPKFKNGELK
jgi:hypothetical protein